MSETSLKTLRVLIVGDVVGIAGRRAVTQLVPKIKQEHNIHVVVVNAENMADCGSGITPETMKELLDADVDLLTGGDHQGKKRDKNGFTMEGEFLLRPLNYEKDPGAGSILLPVKGHEELKLGVINVMGNVFMEKGPSAFGLVSREVEKIKLFTDLVLVDFHAEASSEKVAMGWHVDGTVSAIVGTHTHVQTADERVLPQGTAYMTDLGMTGARDGVIGRKKENVLLKFLHQPHTKFEVATDDVWLNGAIVEIDCATGQSINIERISEFCEDVD